MTNPQPKYTGAQMRTTVVSTIAITISLLSIIHNLFGIGC